MEVILISILIVVGGFVALGFDFPNNPRVYKRRPRQWFALLGFLFIFTGMFVTVNANEVGISYDPLNGGLQ